jgi:hypothetical protein
MAAKQAESCLAVASELAAAAKNTTDAEQAEALTKKAEAFKKLAADMEKDLDKENK